MLKITAVEPHSIADELELTVGDALLRINDTEVRDLLDYLLLEPREELVLEVRKRNGETWVQELEKDRDAPLGLGFEYPVPDECGNSCIFCFVHQLPRGMRRSLYVKDEDYRFSYLYGAYVTLSNLDETAIERIVAQRLSPLYVSVHTVDAALRNRMLGRDCAPVLPLLQRLVAAGIEVHTQVVLCPGINDGRVLTDTIDALAQLRPGILSLAIVPVGLTGHRRGLPELQPPGAAEAAAAIAQIEARQRVFLSEGGTRFVFAADELYLLADREFPSLDAYEELPQLENGVGLIPLFRSDAREVLAEAVPLGGGRVTVVTGESAAAEIESFAARLGELAGFDLVVVPVRNNFFGGRVSVTGLLTGRDVVEQLQERDLGQALLIPAVMCRDGGELLLDDLTLSDLSCRLGVPVLKVEAGPWGIYAALEALAGESRD